MNERALVLRVTKRLAALGYTTMTEVPGAHGRVDLLTASRTGQPVVVEFKVRDPLRAVEQLLGYANDYPGARLVLAIPADLDSELVRVTCGAVGIDVWAIGDHQPVTQEGCPYCVSADGLCAEGIGLWERVGRTRARGDLRGYGRAFRAFSDHVAGTVDGRRSRERLAA